MSRGPGASIYVPPQGSQPSSLLQYGLHWVLHTGTLAPGLALQGLAPKGACACACAWCGPADFLAAQLRDSEARNPGSPRLLAFLAPHHYQP